MKEIVYLLDLSGTLMPLVDEIEEKAAKDEKATKEEGRDIAKELLEQRMSRLREKKIISEFSLIEGRYLGFPIKEPSTDVVYRIDLAANDLQHIARILHLFDFEDLPLEEEYRKMLQDPSKKKLRGWERVFCPYLNSEERMRKLGYVAGMILAKGEEFFGTGNIDMWTKELDLMDKEDPNFKQDGSDLRNNEFSQKALEYFKQKTDYVVARAVIKRGEDQPSSVYGMHPMQDYDMRYWVRTIGM